MRQGCLAIVVFVLMLSAIGMFTRDQEPESVGGELKEQEQPVEGMPFVVPSDPKAAYWLLDVEPMENGNFSAITRRSGSSGVSFARREVDCEQRLFRYLGEGDTKSKALRDSSNIGDMSGLVSGSISDVVVSVVCREASSQ